MRASKRLQKCVDVKVETNEHQPIFCNEIRDYFPKDYLKYPKKVKFEAGCQTSMLDGENNTS